MNARQNTGEAPFKESLSAFHATAGTGGETTVTLNGKEYSSSKSDKSRKRKADEKKVSKKDPKKREKGNTNNPKTAKQYMMELEREIRQAEAEDLSIKQKGNEVQHCSTFVSHYIPGKRIFIYKFKILSVQVSFQKGLRKLLR
jgi:hypothetical protein